MKEEKFILSSGQEVTLQITQEKLEAVLQEIIKFAKKTNQVTGEGMAQNDDCNIYASSVLGDIWDDILKPKIVYED